MGDWPGNFESAVRGYLPGLAADRPLPIDEPLVELGLDSVGLVGLMIDLEAGFGFSFDQSRLTGETFYTAGSLWTEVRAQLAAART